VQPALYISDKRTYELVSGAVFGRTNQPAQRVNSMRSGGALLQGQQCYADLGRFDQLDSGDVTVRNKIEGRWESDRTYTGYDDCWHQSGHNYFSIKFPSRQGTWVNFVTADKQVQVRP
jgi:hypothetical protein